MTDFAVIRLADHRYLITEALLTVAQKARLVANGDTTAMPALRRALDALDAARRAADEDRRSASEVA